MDFLESFIKANTKGIPTQYGGICVVGLHSVYDLVLEFENFEMGKTNPVTKENIYPAGKGLDVAYYLRRMNVPVTFTGFLGRYNDGGFKKFLKQWQIHDESVATEGRIRTNIRMETHTPTPSITDISTLGSLDVQGYKKIMQLRINSLAKRFETFIFSGSLPAGIPVSFYSTLIETVKSHGKTAHLDTSGNALLYCVGQNLDNTMDSAKNSANHTMDSTNNSVQNIGKTTAENSAKNNTPHPPVLPDFIKPNIDEYATLLGRPVDGIKDVIDTIETYQKKGIGTVCVSLGGDGVIVCDDTGLYKGIPPRIDVVSAVGAGDAMVAGLTYGKSLGLNTLNALHMAVALSASVCLCKGPRLPDDNIIQDIFTRCTIEKIR